MSECKWTPVTERWPTEEDADGDGDVIWAWWLEEYKTTEYGELPYNDRSWDGCENLHWFPIPKVPKISLNPEARKVNK